MAFLRSRQRADGLWADFETLAGASTDWVTGYVGAALAAAGGSHSALMLASRRLWGRQQADGGWGYRPEVPTDADSTAYVLRFLLAFGCDGDHRPALCCLRRHRKGPAGGVATYAEPGPIRRYMGLDESFAIDGWCQPHAEVTAAAGLAFGAAGGSWSDDAQIAWRYLRARQEHDGSWRSYWWVDDLYPTAQATVLARTMGDEAGGRQAAARAAAWVAGRQSSDGAWAPQRDGEASAFLSALGVIVLTSARRCTASAERGVAGLLAQQHADGGWASNPILQIPPPHVVEPDEVPNWRDDDLGTAVVISDRGRLYTTATALSALCLASR